MNRGTRVYDNIFEMMPGEENPTPMVKRNRIDFPLYPKLEWLNPFGSVKDRATWRTFESHLVCAQAFDWLEQRKNLRPQLDRIWQRRRGADRERVKLYRASAALELNAAEIFWCSIALEWRAQGFRSPRATNESRQDQDRHHVRQDLDELNRDRLSSP